MFQVIELGWWSCFLLVLLFLSHSWGSMNLDSPHTFAGDKVWSRILQEVWSGFFLTTLCWQISSCNSLCLHWALLSRRSDNRPNCPSVKGDLVGATSKLATYTRLYRLILSLIFRHPRHSLYTATSLSTCPLSGHRHFCMCWILIWHLLLYSPRHHDTHPTWKYHWTYRPLKVLNDLI